MTINDINAIITPFRVIGHEDGLRIVNQNVISVFEFLDAQRKFYLTPFIQAALENPRSEVRSHSVTQTTSAEFWNSSRSAAVSYFIPIFVELIAERGEYAKDFVLNTVPLQNGDVELILRYNI